MSVSEGLKKLKYKSYYVKLNKLDEYGNITSQPSILQIKVKIQPWTHIKEIKQKIAKTKTKEGKMKLIKFIKKK